MSASFALTLTPALDETVDLAVHGFQGMDCSTILQ
jgi:hypothetical protein